MDPITNAQAELTEAEALATEARKKLKAAQATGLDIESLLRGLDRMSKVAPYKRFFEEEPS